MLQGSVAVCYRIPTLCYWVVSVYVTGYLHCVLQGTVTVNYRELLLYVTGYHHCMLQGSVDVCYRILSLYITRYCHCTLQGAVALCCRIPLLYVTGSCRCMLQDTIIVCYCAATVCYRVPSSCFTVYAFFLKSGIDKSAEWSTIPACPSLVGFFFFLNRGNTEGSNSSKMLCLIFLYVCIV